MAKLKHKRKAARASIERFARPTEQREAHNDFRSAGAAVKAVPPIETMFTKGTLSARQYAGLSRYADIANAAERSEIKCPMDFSVHGNGGEGLPHFGVRMNIEMGYLERELGSLRDIARAICVDEISLSQWAMNQAGSVMRERQIGVYRFERWYEPSPEAHATALLEIRMAGERLASAIKA